MTRTIEQIEAGIALVTKGIIALELSLRLNTDTLKVLNDCLHGLEEERNAWEDAQRVADEEADEGAELEYLASQAEYYDRFAMGE